MRFAIVGLAMVLAGPAYAECAFVFMPCPEAGPGLTPSQFMVSAACDHPVNKTEEDRLTNLEVCKQAKAEVAKEQAEANAKAYKDLLNQPAPPPPSVTEQLDQINKKLDALQK